jgi:hypothetical protein|tara:strand:+ start:567 stop:803 length:237 start_codon:yes stop_codon:yes gene_type:complete
MSLFPGFGGAPSIPPPPAPPPPPPDPPKRDDPAVLKAKDTLKASEKLRRGRGSSILTSSRGIVGGDIDQPSAGSDTLG